jgi:hypothetical protein
MNSKLLCVVFLVLTFFSCKESKRSLEYPEFEERYKEWFGKQSANDYAVLNVEMLTSFNWDYLYIFTPYTPIDTLKRIINIEWEEASETMIHYIESDNLLVFIESGKVVRYSKLSRNIGDFMRLETSGPFLSEDSKFVLKKEMYGGQFWHMLYKVDLELVE